VTALDSQWRSVAPAEDQAVLAAAGMGAPQPLGSMPALVVIDVTRAFVGTRGLTRIEAAEEYRTSCGPAAWQALPAMLRVVKAARRRGIPVLYTRAPAEPTAVDQGSWGAKSRRPGTPGFARALHEIVPELTPEPGEVVLDKVKPSAFFGTPLISHLVEHRVDTIVLVGGTTSGCVRATAVDAFSHNYRTVVVEDAVFDRAQVSHDVALFDLNGRYASVLTSDDVTTYLAEPTAWTPTDS
jgi:maleamate amidohydrolase